MLCRWPEYVSQKSQGQAGFLNQDEQQLNQIQEYETANSLVRALLTQLISALKDEQMRQGLSQKSGLNLTNSIHKNLIHLVILVEEMIFSSHGK